MDIVTQALLGAAVAQSVSKKNELRLATWIGLIAGVLADADILISSSSDPLLTLEYHRHFTHSVFFIPVGALIAAMLIWLVITKCRSSVDVSFRQIYLYSLAGYSLSGFIDACTSYGTSLLWPVYDQRISFNIISIVDPVFSFILIVATVLAWRKSRQIFARVGLIFAALYLTVGLMQNYRAEQQLNDLIKARQHQADKILVKPSFANILLWRMVYIADKTIYVDAVQLGLSTKIYPGESVPLFEMEDEYPEINKSSALYHDVKRFSHFSDGFIARSPLDQSVIGDIRYSMLPNSARPIWGITLQTDQPDKHAEYGFYRENNEKMRQQFKQMLLGR